MRYFLLLSVLLSGTAAAEAAPQSSCAAKFIGDWRHSGSGNRGTLLPDGRALCSEHPACVQGTWTCSGNVLTYTNSAGTWNYTLEPDGKSMSTNGGAATAVRIGAVPANARSRDLGSAAKNVTADILGVDRTQPNPAATPITNPVAEPPSSVVRPPRTVSSAPQSDPSQCVVEKAWPKAPGVNWYSLKNSCKRRVTLDYDDCDLNLSTNMVQCSTKTLPLAPRSEFGPVPNHKHPLNARDFR